METLREAERYTESAERKKLARAAGALIIGSEKWLTWQFGLPKRH